MTVSVSELDSCPSCAVRWRYGGDDDRAYSKIVAIYDRGQDRTVAWQCPFCGRQWARGATVAQP